MPVINIYVNDEVFIKLKKEDNKSALVTGLLEEHYAKTARPDVKDIAQELAQVDERKKILENTMTKVIVEKQVEELTEKDKFEKEQKKLSEKVESVRRMASSFFDDFKKISVNEQNKVIDDYLYNNPDGLNIMLFFSEKGFKDNIPEEETKK